MRELQRAFLAAALGVAALACGGTDGPGGGGGSGGSGGTIPVEAPECADDAVCSFDEICIAERCKLLCSRHGECGLGEYCIESDRGARVCSTVEPQNECVDDSDCLADEICGNGACLPGSVTEGCLTTAECYFGSGYCADVGETTACIDVSCGSPENACSRCQLGPNGGAAEAGGPLLYFPNQVGACWQDANACVPGVAPFVCAFSFLAWDPDDDLPSSDLETHVRYVGADGTVVPTFGTTRLNVEGYTGYGFRACFPSRADGKVEGAVYLFDDGLRVSQTLCIAGDLN